MRLPRGLRGMLSKFEGEWAPIYGLSAAVAITVPLFLGLRLDRVGDGVIVALGTYLTAARAPEGTYGQKARSLLVIVAMIGVGELIGGYQVGNRWLSVLFVPILVVIGNLVPRIGLTPALAAMFAALRPPAQDPVAAALLSMLGAGVMAALVLAPWPGRRLRPLTDALAEAVDAVAGALDRVAAPPERWEKARRRAADAIVHARTTYGVYNTSSDDDRPSRLITAVIKIMHEVVGLRTLIDAEAARPLREVPETEIWAAVAMEAARIRLLAEAITNPALVPPRSVPHNALDQLGGKIDKARKDAFAGDEDIVAAALAAQFWRSLQRLDSTIASAGRIVASGITLRPAMVPRIPGPPDPSSLWRRLVLALRIWPPRLRQAVRAGVTVMAALALWATSDLPHGHWLPLATLLCLRGTYGETVDRALVRVGGTVLGSALAAVLLYVAPDRPVLAAIIFLLALFGFMLSPVSYLIWVVLCTPLVLMLIDFDLTVPWGAAVDRILLTLGGCALALLAARLLWPAAPTDQLPVLLAKLLRQHAEVIRAVTDEGSSLSPWLRPAQESAQAIAAEADRLGHDPAPDTELVARLRKVVAGAHRLRDEAISVAGVARAESAGAGPVSSILERLADHLTESADAIAAGDEPSSIPPLDLSDLLGDLDNQLSQLVKRRRAEVDQGTSLADTTPLRTDLLGVAAVRHALRTLTADAETLAKAAAVSA